MNNIFVREVVAGSAYRATWVSPTGAIPSQITSAIKNSSNTVINSLTPVSSGNGYFYCDHQLPNSAQPFINEWRAWINSYEFVGRAIVRALDIKVD